MRLIIEMKWGKSSDKDIQPMVAKKYNQWTIGDQRHGNSKKYVDLDIQIDSPNADTGRFSQFQVEAIARSVSVNSNSITFQTPVFSTLTYEWINMLILVKDKGR